MKCVECGEVEGVYNYLCKNCFVLDSKIISSKTRLKLTLCKFCNSPSIKPDLWYEVDEENYKDVIDKSLVDLIDLKYKIHLREKVILVQKIDERLYDISDPIDVVNGNFKISGTPDLFLPEISITEETEIFVKYRKCKNCQLLSTGGSVKAKVQLRCIKNLITVVDKSLTNLYSLEKNKDIKNFLPIEESKLRDGWDFTYRDKKGAEYLTNFLKSNFGAFVIETKESISYDRIKNKARSKIVFSARLPPYLIGDVILIEDVPNQVLDIKTSQTIIFNFALSEKIVIENESIIKSKVKNIFPRDSLTEFSIISVNNFSKSFQLMNLENFELYELNFLENVNIQENQVIYGFFWDDELHISRLDLKNLLNFENDEKVFV